MAQPTDDDSTLSRIRNHYQHLPPSERKLADLILDFPGDVASYSATELADLAGVSKAAATRLFRRLGYDSFEQARRSAREQQDWGSPLYMLSQKPEIDVPDSYLRRQMEQELAMMARTFEALDLRKLERLGKSLMGARRIWLLGYRHSYFLADYARWQFLQVRDQVQLLVSEGSTLAEQMVSFSSDDIVVAIGFRRRTLRFRQTLRIIQKKKIPILYITEPNVGATINFATWVLHADVSGGGPFDSYPAASSLIHLLSIVMLKHAGREGRERIQRVEDIHTELHDFD
ncbi:MAG: MurR/RpiR family transcriptional regulator [Gammaproteobacteria bacterium]|nr:MurR/RpiR family transcriptional regulator [Gammaproteobacteria bacterium]